MQKHLLIDCHNLVWKSYYIFGDLEWYERPTGILFGFLSSIKTLASTFNPCGFYFCWDAKKSLRKELFPAYKEQRSKKKQTEQEEEWKELVYDQVDVLRDDILPNLGFKNNFYVEGYEADDLIAVLCTKLDGMKIIVSTDNDLYQLLSDRVCLYDTKKKKRYTKRTFEREYGITPDQWVDVKAWAGCSSDEVPGVEKVGVKTAIKYLRGELKSSTKAYKRIQEGINIYQRNLPLVKLPFTPAPEIEPIVQIPTQLNKRYFLDMCDKYNFASFLKNFNKWTELFNMI